MLFIFLIRGKWRHFETLISISSGENCEWNLSMMEEKNICSENSFMLFFSLNFIEMDKRWKMKAMSKRAEEKKINSIKANLVFSFWFCVPTVKNCVSFSTDKSFVCCYFYLWKGGQSSPGNNVASKCFLSILDGRKSSPLDFVHIKSTFVRWKRVNAMAIWGKSPRNPEVTWISHTTTETGQRT